MVAVGVVAVIFSSAQPGISQTTDTTAGGGNAPRALVHDHAAAVESALRALVDSKSLSSGQIGVAVLDLGTGHLLAASNEHIALNPASNAKILTAGAALSLLHGDHRYETMLFGTLKDGEISGNLTIRGDGDPSLTTTDLVSMVEELRTRGVRRISGDIVVDQHFFDGETTPPAFEQQPNEWASFRAPVAAVSLNENTLQMTVRPTSPGQPAHVTFDPPGFIDQDGTVSTSESGDSVGLALAGSGKRMTAKISGSVGADAKLIRYQRRVEDPTLLAGFALKAALDRAGIKVQGEVKEGTVTKGTSLVSHSSRPLSELLYEVGKNSNNFYAEMVLKSLGGEKKARPARSKDGADVVTDWLQKIGAYENGMIVKNGSGLFDSNRVTAQSIVLILRQMALDPTVAAEFRAQLAIGGVDGTLHKRFRQADVKRLVRAKTGTLEDVASLSGYIEGPPGKSALAFSIIINKIPGKVSAGRAAIDRFVRATVAYAHGRAPEKGGGPVEEEKSAD